MPEAVPIIQLTPATCQPTSPCSGDGVLAYRHILCIALWCQSHLASCRQDD